MPSQPSNDDQLGGSVFEPCFCGRARVAPPVGASLRGRTPRGHSGSANSAQLTGAAFNLFVLKESVMISAHTTPSCVHGQHESQLVTFRLGSVEFGFDIMSVQEIIRQPILLHIPMAPNYVDGIANLRGTILPVIDTRSRFGMERCEDTDSTRVLVIDVDGVKTGLRVDRVCQVTRIQTSDVEPPPAVIRSGVSEVYLEGLIKLEGGERIIMALSPGAVAKVEKVDPSANPRAPLGSRPETIGRNSSTPDQSGNESESDEPPTLLVSFKLGEEEFAFPMESVREILRVERPSAVPDSPDALLGVVSVRGSVLPVVDLRTLLELPKLSAELQAGSQRIRRDYEQWISLLAAHVVGGSTPAPDTTGADSLRAWISDFNTSSDELVGVLSRTHVANEKVIRGCRRLGTLTDPSSRRDQLDREIRPSAAQALGGLAELERRLVENISDDQRLIVVQTDGTPLAFVVDKVREVLRVPTKLIDAPPRLGRAHANRNIRGVAKLNGGDRLIMLLDIDQMLHQQGLEAAKQAAATAVASREAERAGREEGQQRKMEQTTEERQFVVFRLADCEYGIPISEIQEIDRSSKITRIPTSADYVDGVMNLRGEVVPVMNARKRMRLPLVEADERERVIMIDIHGQKTGLRVDSVREVLNVALSNIVPPPDSIRPEVDPRYIAGIGQVDSGKRTIVLLDAGRIIGADSP